MTYKFAIIVAAASLSAQPGFEAGIGNTRAARDGKTAETEKKAEARAACKVTNSLGSLADSIGGAPKFDIKDLGEKKTAGWLRTSGKPAVKVGSPGVAGATRPAGWKDKVVEMFSGNRYGQADAGKIANHAEGQAAGLMREGGIKKAYLDINNDYVCRECLWFVEHILPDGYELIVRFIDKAGKRQEVRFCGWD